jgi:flagellin-like protein
LNPDTQFLLALHDQVKLIIKSPGQTRSKSAVTPVIATIILIAATIILAMTVGAYSYGLFGSDVKQIGLTSASLYSGTATTTSSQGYANLQISFVNPSSQTKISSIVLTGMGLTTTTIYQCSSPTSCAAINSPTVLANGVTYFNTVTTAFYPGAILVSGGGYSYTINFANGQSISGYLIAQ